MSGDAPKAPSPTASGSEPSRPASGGALPAVDYYDQLVRLKAEFENFRKRVDREKPELYKLGRAELIGRFLPIYDLLNRAHEQVQATHAQSELAQGLEGIFKEFEKIFKEEGVSAMSPKGKPYDPQSHEVLGTVADSGLEDGSVVEVLQNGFMLRDKVLRTAKVRIARKPAPEDKKEAKS